MVFEHHFAITRQFQATGRWEVTPSPFWNLLGQVAVALFFMITGFLFFGKIQAARGKLRALPFFAGRVFRLFPVYLATLAVVAVIAALQGAPGSSVSAAEYVDQALHWITFGGSRMLGLQDAARVIAYVPWSLRYEWVFYAMLPLIAVGWRWLRLAAWPVFSATVLALAMAAAPRQIPGLEINSVHFAPFALGGCISLLRPNGAALAALRGGWGVSLAAGALLIEFATQSTAYSPLSYLLLATAFAPIALGNTCFGLLARAQFQVLGAISYDIYLVHGVVLYVAYTVFAPTALLGSSGAFLAAHLMGVGAIVIMVSILMHRMIEVPANAYGSSYAKTGLRERLAAP
jgi:peptidoglycan/LPS O-acetylase OafA/YrhL